MTPAPAAELQREGRPWVGQPLLRKEDARFVAGVGRYVDDIRVEGMAHAAILRSIHAHAKIRSIDVSRAAQMQGVLSVMTGNDVREMTDPFSLTARVPVEYYCMAVGKVRYVGEPVVAVVARTPEIAQDALDLVSIDYEPLPPLLGYDGPAGSTEPLHEGVPDGVVWRDSFSFGDVETAFKEADVVVEDTLTFPRNAPAPIETFGCIAEFDTGTNGVTITYNGQIPRVDQIAIAGALRLPPESVRLVVPDVGGAFGGKVVVYPYAVLTSVLSKKASKPVKWIERRTENLAAGAQASGRRFDIRMALEKGGRVLGLEARIVEDIGAYPRPPEPVGVLRPFETFTGCYKIENVKIDVRVTMTNKSPSGPSRGYGCQHNYFMLERMMDIAARRLGLDRAEVRFVNFIEPDEFPYTTAIGCVYDSGRYRLLLQDALEKIGYERAERRQSSAGGPGALVGIGFATIVEPGGSNFSLSQLFNPDLAAVSIGEAATVRVHQSGKITVLIGTTPQGQGVETAAAQIVADELGVSPSEVQVGTGFDSATHPSTYTSGTFSSKFASVGVGAVAMAARRVRVNLAQAAARIAGLDSAGVRFEAGEARLAGKKVQSLTLREIADVASEDPELSRLLEATETYVFPGMGAPDADRRGNYSATYGSSAHAAIVEVDPAVGTVRLLRYVVVHDCGKEINPVIVQGQVHGGVVQGIGAALSEECRYDPNGQMLTSTFMDYGLPSSVSTVDIETLSVETPSPFTLLGTKGVGEGGTMAAPAAVANAVEDALWSLGVRVREVPLSADKVWQLIRDSRG